MRGPRLAARGHEVLVLDGRDGDMRASQGNFGLVWLQGKGAGYAPYARWSFQAVQAWPDFAKRLSGLVDVDLALCQQGGYEFFTDAAEYEAFGHDLHRQANALDDRLSFELLNHADLAARLPGIGQRVVGASFCPLDGHVNPLRLHFALRQACLASGVRITGGASVVSVRPAGAGFALWTRPAVRPAPAAWFCARAWGGASWPAAGVPGADPGAAGRADDHRAGGRPPALPLQHDPAGR
ncbi:NAD(P)/FAD-dependent oxidoreductase [Gemmobacter lanyuensis]